MSCVRRPSQERDHLPAAMKWSSLTGVVDRRRDGFVEAEGNQTIMRYTRKHGLRLEMRLMRMRKATSFQRRNLQKKRQAESAEWNQDSCDAERSVGGVTTRDQESLGGYV